MDYEGVVTICDADASIAPTAPSVGGEDAGAKRAARTFCIEVDMADVGRCDLEQFVLLGVGFTTIWPSGSAGEST